ncbi:polysaccharide deacetylase family protein [Bacillus testis]|uniref:polysaccharide deacetylase family protein n=1 Tax=Bacillus testis TaxID=1622072 RepID=UPI00067EB4D6|nr:polysaccharide deacetylase family protein [Bacillus testis]
MNRRIVYVLSLISFVLLAAIIWRMEAHPQSVKAVKNKIVVMDMKDTAKLEGKSASADKPTGAPQIKNNSVYVPAMELAKQFNAKTSWKDGSNEIFTMAVGSSTADFYINRNKAYLNNQLLTSTLNAYYHKGELYLPAGIVAKALNQDIARFGNQIAVGSGDKMDAYKKHQMEGKIPVLMYHHFDYNKQNGLTVNPNVFYQQMKLLKDQGYTTLTSQDVIDIENGKAKLPAKPLMITMDDGYESNYTYVYPALKKLGMKATIFIITDYVEHPENHPSPYPKLTWKEMEEMSASGVISFQSHTNNLHFVQNGSGAIAGPLIINGKRETDQEFRARVYNDLLLSKRLLEEHLGKPVTTIAYPVGNYSQASEELVKQAGFQMSLTTKPGLLDLKRDTLYEVKRVNIHGHASVDSVLSTIKKVEAMPEQNEISSEAMIGEGLSPADH